VFPWRRWRSEPTRCPFLEVNTQEDLAAAEARFGQPALREAQSGRGVGFGVEQALAVDRVFADQALRFG
jgi:hypothetical protein